MCNLFAETDPMLYEARQRSIRINGVITSIRLENLMWDVLADMAQQQGCSTIELISHLHQGLLTGDGGPSNFTSFLRVTCVHHLRRALEGALPGIPDGPTPPSDGASRARH